ncbi:MAG TPA: aldehyde dehydrogenase family protein, partial [Pseudogracilibacillus sp.]|nr:aldehyde dehydrogenase family protein [Pseudogracilibacillus sp.]
EGLVLFALNQGEVCTCPSRALIHELIYDDFMERAIARVNEIKIGHPLETDTMMGAQASTEQMEKIMSYLEIGKDEGAEVLIGGSANKLEGELGNGYYVKPTIFKGHNKMRIFQEEIFGPVIALVKADNIVEAIDVANETKYGLSASIFTENIGEILEFIEEMKAGLVRINAESAGVELQAPFGGMKASSTGAREQGEAAKEFYTEVKTVFIKE